jgi:ribonuclease J
LGGLGEIGMNCLAIEQADGVLVVDCGTSFPHEDLGVDVYHPSFDWLVDNVARISGVFLTHGHEDHIGGLPYLLDQLDIPVWGPPHALGLAWKRLEEHEFSPGDVRLREARVGNRYEIGPFQVEPIRVTHSIVEASALAIRTRAGLVVHSGDFNFDPDPPDGEPTDEARLEALGDEGVELLLSDSTNVDTLVRAGSEREVGAALERIVSAARARVVISLFASNIQRLRMLGEIAKTCGRKVCLLGRSLNTQREVATAIRRLSWPSDLLVSPEQAKNLPGRRLLVLAGGSQAEPGSALYKLANGTHNTLSLDSGDTVILSSRVIPGNERAVFSMQNALLRRGVELHTQKTDPDVHTSGHGGQSEQTRMIELVRPSTFIPIHGTLHHMLRHAGLAGELGVDRVLVLENGQSARLDAEASLRRDGSFAHGRQAVAPGAVPLADDVLRRRQELARFGVVSVCVVLDARNEVVGVPTVRARGVPNLDGDEDVAQRIGRDVSAELARVRARRGVDFEEEARRAARRRISEISGTRPVVEVHVQRV